MITIEQLKSLSNSGVYALSLDPGTKGSGLCFWDLEEYMSTEICMPKKVLNLIPRGTGSWISSSHELHMAFNFIFNNVQIARVDSEFPQFFADSAGGHATAARGDLQKLTFVVGVFCSVTWAHRVPFFPWEVNEWKGQMSKEVTEKAIRRRLANIDILHPQSHSWDAIGIGLHAQGKFLNKRTDKHGY